ncbi:hypothetical protein V6N13_134563 [Hibiscus sabdariffa]
MADALVSALVSTILNNLNSLFLEEVRLAGSLRTELESLQSTFTTIQAVLHDAEQKQWKNEAIKNWLGKLEQAAYDLEDVLDDFQYEARRRGSKVSTFFSLQNPLLFRSIMAHRVKTAREKVDAIAEERIKFHLEVGVGEAVIKGNKDRETSSLVDESEVIGRADEKGEMVSMILSNATHCDGLSVYAICGMGGLGKSCDIQDLDPLQRRLVEQLVGKRFLIVLDDVWNEFHEEWDRLKQALQSGRSGSTVIVTTRLEKVADMMATVPFRRLGCLTDGDSWSLFKQRAFGMGTNEGNANLETIGRRIVQRCGGVPLAIKAVGSILRSKSQESEWLNVRDSEIWDLEDEVSRILAVLSSSRNVMDLSKLPPLRSLILDSKSHFVCNISNPSNFISNQKHLKVLDCGDRFINVAFNSLKHLRYLRFHDPRVKALPESISSLHNLQTLNLQRCKFLQMLPNGLKKLKNLKYLELRGCDELISMPVGLGELTCLRKLSKFIVGVDKGGGIDELKELALEGELSITGLCNVKNSTEARNANLIEKKNLRSLRLSWPRNDWERTHHEHGNDEEILDALQPHPSLKKLGINDYQGVRFPNCMMDLLLPNLVEIELVDCGRCDQLPPLGKLRFLRVLTIRGMGALKRIDIGFYGDMESSFPSLEVLELDGAGCLEEWRTMNGGEHFPLLNYLTIRDCCPKLVKLPMLQSLKVVVVKNANVTLLESLMMNATNLTSLRLFQYGEPIMDLPDGLLRNHKQLETLSIANCSLKSSSDLLNNLSSLKRLELHNCSQLESLPRGLQNLRCLESLSLIGCDSLVSLAVNGLSSLSSLEIMSCEKLSSLTESLQHLSSLRRLSIWRCERLSGLPNEIQHLTSLSTLEIVGCPDMMSLPQGVRSLTALQTLIIEECPHLERRCKKETGEDWPLIAHIPHIQITSTSDWTCGLSEVKARFCSQS